MSESKFKVQIKAAEKSPEACDFGALRRAYVESEDYAPTSHFSYHKLIGHTNSAQSFEEVVQFCEGIVERNPMDLEARMMLEFACERLEWFELAAKQHAFVEEMLKALFASGDGKSVESAWHVVSVAEEYTVLSVMSLKLLRQELLEIDGRFYDILSVQPSADPDKATFQLFFDVTDPLRFLQN